MTRDGKSTKKNRNVKEKIFFLLKINNDNWSLIIENTKAIKKQML